MWLCVKGGGLIFGKICIDYGIGKFIGVNSIVDIKGYYVNVEVYVGVEKLVDV